MGTALVRFLGLGTAVVAGGVLLVGPSAGSQPSQPERSTAAAAWPSATRAAIPALLPDGATYRPEIFLDARTSVGTAPSPDGTFVRLVLRGADASVRDLRRVRLDQRPSFQAFAVAGDVLAWAEGAKGSGTTMWAAGLRGTAPARRLTADTGAAVFYGSQYSLLIADGRLRWVAEKGDVTEVRSMALTGGRVDVRAEPGSWVSSAWPWLVNGATDAAGTSMLRNVVTRQDVAVPRTRRATTGCSPVWCRVVSLSRDGARVELMRPDGSTRQRIAGDATTVIADVVPLDRFEVLAQAGPNSDMTGNAQLIVYDMVARRTVEVSPDAGNVSYRAGVLWWSTGDQDSFLWHTVDLRTV
jgi:hypothetical protein